MRENRLSRFAQSYERPIFGCKDSRMAIIELPNDPRPPRCQHTGVDLRNGRCADCKRAYERWYIRTRRATDADFAARRRVLATTGAARRKAERDAASAGQPNPSSSRRKHRYADYLELIGKADMAERSGRRRCQNGRNLSQKRWLGLLTNSRLSGHGLRSARRLRNSLAQDPRGLIRLVTHSSMQRDGAWLACHETTAYQHRDTCGHRCA